MTKHAFCAALRSGEPGHREVDLLAAAYISCKVTMAVKVESDERKL